VVLFHLIIFMERYRNIFSKNLLVEVLSQISSYGKSTLKKDFLNNDFLKLSQRIKEKEKNFGNVFEKMIEVIFQNKDNYFGLGNGEVFELLPGQLKEFKDIWLMQKEILENKINENGIIKVDENEMIEILYSFHYQFCLYANYIFNFDYEKFIISFFEKNECKNDLLKSFFSSLYFNYLLKDEKRNVKNIINQKTIMRFSTLQKYFSENNGFLHVVYYGLYLYLDYLKFLIKELNINDDVFCKFVEKIKKKRLKNS